MWPSPAVIAILLELCAQKMLHEKNIPHCASVQCDLRGITPRHKEDLMRFLVFFFLSFFAIGTFGYSLPL